MKPKNSLDEETFSTASHVSDDLHYAYHKENRITSSAVTAINASKSKSLQYRAEDVLLCGVSVSDKMSVTDSNSSVRFSVSDVDVIITSVNGRLTRMGFIGERPTFRCSLISSGSDKESSRGIPLEAFVMMYVSVLYIADSVCCDCTKISCKFDNCSLNLTVTAEAKSPLVPIARGGKVMCLSSVIPEFSQHLLLADSLSRDAEMSLSCYCDGRVLIFEMENDPGYYPEVEFKETDVLLSLDNATVKAIRLLS